jgi:hypothetical protein
MKITITADGGSPVTLCDHGREGPGSLVITPIRKIDVLPFVQSPYAKPKDRGNVLHQITFTVRNEHATMTAAQLATLLIHTAVPASGEVDIELEDQQTHVVIREATCEIAPQPLIGVLSTITYTLKFGKIEEAVQVLDSEGNTLLSSDDLGIFVNAET